MKIFLVGEFSRGSLCDSYARSFKRLGHQICIFDEPRQYENIAAKFKKPLFRRILDPFFTSQLNNTVISACAEFTPDLIVIFKGQYIFTRTLSRIKGESKAKLININADDPFNNNRGASSRHVRSAVTSFDCYFIWSKEITIKLAKAGAKKVKYLPFAFDPDICYPQSSGGSNEADFAHDLVFVGNWDITRERWLSCISDFDLVLWGSDYWLRRCKNKNLTKLWRGREARNEEMAKAFTFAKISLNILRDQNKGSINMRTFEAPACKAFVIAERSAEQQSFFTEDKEAVYFSSPQELQDKIRYYLKNESKRVNIAEAGYNRAINSGYTYYDRAKEVIASI